MQGVKRMTEEAQEQASQMGEAAEAGFEAASRSFAEATKGFQAIASEMNDFSRRRLEDVLQSWQQFLSARSFGDVVEAQTQYAERAYEAYASEMSKLGEMYLRTARNAAKPVAQSTKRRT
jgi:phasin family protein